MRLHRFYIPETIGTKTEIILNAPDQIHQIRRVFRLKSGDKLVIFDGSGSDYVCTLDDTYNRRILTGDNSIIHLTITSVGRSRFMAPHKLSLAAALVKKDTFEWIAQKATELGVTDIVPIQSERSEKKSLNDERLTKIVVEAGEQSGRGDIPVIHDVRGLEDAVTFLKNAGAKLVAFHTEGKTFDRSAISAKKGALGVFIGPEGGWSETELEVFHRHGVEVVCLGSQVLRAETAVVAALSQVVFG